MTSEPRDSVAPRRMLPPPTTIVSSTPCEATRDACRAIRLTSSTSMPPSPGRQKLSPESFRRTRRKAGGPVVGGASIALSLPAGVGGLVREWVEGGGGRTPGRPRSTASVLRLARAGRLADDEP